MISKKQLIGNELLREIITIRIDSLAKLVDLYRKGQLPKAHDEGAAGDFDNKGAIFIPGGLVFEDSDRRSIRKIDYSSTSPKAFREVVSSSMKEDNATLLYSDGYCSSVNLDNGFYTEMSSRILATRRASRQRSRTLEQKPPERIVSEEICKSQCPKAIQPPFGARTKVSSCVAVCLVEPRLFYTQYSNDLALSESDSSRVWNSIRTSLRPVTGSNDTVLAPPYVVVCHQTRYLENAMGGITRILGIGGFGEFAVISFELLTRDLSTELKEKNVNWSEKEVITTCEETPILGIIRIYPHTSLGARSPHSRIMVLSPAHDCGIDAEKILHNARQRYTVE